MFLGSFATSAASALARKIKPTKTTVSAPTTQQSTQPNINPQQQPPLPMSMGNGSVRFGNGLTMTAPNGFQMSGDGSTINFGVSPSAQNYQPYFLGEGRSVTTSSNDPIVRDSDLPRGPRFNLFTEQGWFQKYNNDRLQIAMHDFKNLMQPRPQNPDLLSNDSRIQSLRNLYSFKGTYNRGGLTGGMMMRNPMM